MQLDENTYRVYYPRNPVLIKGVKTASRTAQSCRRYLTGEIDVLMCGYELGPCFYITPHSNSHLGPYVERFPGPDDAAAHYHREVYA